MSRRSRTESSCGPATPRSPPSSTTAPTATGRTGFGPRSAADTAIVWHCAAEGEETVGCVGSIAVGDDCVITGVATPPEHRRRGIAGWLLWKALDRARAEGLMTGSLQASKAGAPLYERLGFSDFGFFELWERRR